jgi:hypothetical protein
LLRGGLSQIYTLFDVVTTLKQIELFKFDDDGITDEIIDARRPNSYFMPIARPRQRGRQLQFDTEWTKDRIEENKTVNRIRERAGVWRKGGYVDVTPVTRRLLEYWTDPEREKKLFFCQIEALETLIYINEVAHKYDPWIANELRAAKVILELAMKARELEDLERRVTALESGLPHNNGRVK